MTFNFRNFILWFWIGFFIVLILIYFLVPELFYRMTSYTGPGGPFVQPP